MDEDELVSEEEDERVRHLYAASCSSLTVRTIDGGFFCRSKGQGHSRATTEEAG